MTSVLRHINKAAQALWSTGHAAMLCVLCFGMLVGMSACSGQRGKLRINAELDGAEQLPIYIIGTDGALDHIDTLTLQGGTARYQSNLADEATYRVFFSGNRSLAFWGHSGDVLTIKGSIQDLKHVKIEGNEENELYTKFRLSVADMQTDDSIRIEAHNFITENASSPVSIELFDQYFYSNVNAEKAETQQLLQTLLKAQPDANRLVAFNAAIKQHDKLAVGQPMPDFDLTDTKGTRHRLADYRGRYLLLVFWAGWQSSGNNMFFQAKQFRDNGHEGRLDVLGYSLDIDRQLFNSNNQRNYDFPSVCDFESWSGPFIKKLGIRTIPYGILVDPNGKIVATGSDYFENIKPSVDKIR